MGEYSGGVNGQIVGDLLGYVSNECEEHVADLFKVLARCIAGLIRAFTACLFFDQVRLRVGRGVFGRKGAATGHSLSPGPLSGKRPCGGQDQRRPRDVGKVVVVQL